MKKSKTAAGATSTTLRQPAKYEYDDTPKAFKRMLQRKNGDPTAYKKMKEGNNGEEVSKDTANTVNISNTTKITNTPNISRNNPVKTTTKASTPSGFKTIRAKRKSHLQTRDLKKKLKRYDSHLESTQTISDLRKDVRDVVQEPPKLHKPKQTFKKMREASETIKSWSDDENLSSEAE